MTLQGVKKAKYESLKFISKQQWCKNNELRKEINGMCETYFRSTGLVQAVKLEGQKLVNSLMSSRDSTISEFKLMLSHDCASSYKARLTVNFF